MRRALVLSHRAEADLREIWVYSFKTWGAAQADRYLDELGVGLQSCGAEPAGGKQRDELRPGCWSRLVRRHVVFYAFRDDEVLVLRVLHGSMDPTLHLPDDDSEI